MLLTILVILVIIFALFFLRGFFGRKLEKTVLQQNVKKIREHIVSLGDNGYVIADGLSQTNLRFINHTLEISVFDHRPKYDAAAVERLHLTTHKAQGDNYFTHTYRLNANMTIIESYVLLFLCSKELKKAYPSDTVNVYYKEGSLIVTVDNAEIVRQREKIKAAGLVNLQNKAEELFAKYGSNGFLPPWLVEQFVDVLQKSGYSFDEAKDYVVALMVKVSMDVDTEYKTYTIPRTLPDNEFNQALLASQSDALDRQIPIDDIVAFRIRCIPGETELSAKTAITATQILRKNGGLSSIS